MEFSGSARPAVSTPVYSMQACSQVSNGLASQNSGFVIASGNILRLVKPPIYRNHATGLRVESRPHLGTSTAPTRRGHVFSHSQFAPIRARRRDSRIPRTL